MSGGAGAGRLRPSSRLQAVQQPHLSGADTGLEEPGSHQRGKALLIFTSTSYLGAEKARKTSERYFGTQDEVQAHTVTRALQQQRCSRQGTSKLCRPFHSILHPQASFSSPRTSPPEDLSCFINLNYPLALRNSDSLLLPKAKVVGVEDKRPSATHRSATAACGSARLTALAGELQQCDSPAALTSAMLLPASSATGLVVMCTAWGASLESKILTAINILLISAGSVYL